MPSWQQRVFFRPKHRKVVTRAHVVLRAVRRRVDGDPRPQNRSNRSCIISFLVPTSDVLLTLLYPTLSLSLPLFIYLSLSLHRTYSFDIP